MRNFLRIGVLVVGGSYIAYLSYVLFGALEGWRGGLFDWGLLLWIFSPVVFLIWRGFAAPLMLIALVVIVLFGIGIEQDIASSRSSTAAIGWLFLPLYQWVFIGIAEIVQLVVKRIQNDNAGSN